MEKSPKIPGESRPYEVGGVLSPERREHVRSQTQKKILAAVFAGAFAAGIFYEKPGPKPEARQEQTTMASMPEVTPITEKEREKQAELEKLVDELTRDVDFVSEFMLRMSTLRWQEPFFSRYMTERPIQEKRPEPSISNMEKTGIDTEIFAELIAKTHPASWYAHLKSIGLANENKKLESVYGAELKNADSCASAGYDKKNKQTEIIFYPICQNKNKILQVTEHELGHAVDWESNNILSQEERMLFLKKVLERTKSGDRFISAHYVEKINPKDIHAKNYMRAQEYWAEIIREYMRNPPQILKKNGGPNILADDDIKLIEWFLEKTDPDFDAEDAWHKRAILTSWEYDPSTRKTTPPKINAKNNGGEDPISVTLNAGNNK